MHILVLFPTATEAQYFSRPDVTVAVSGVGLTATAYHTARLIQAQRPDWVILAGIAGVYPGSAYRIGDTVLVASEREADLGFFTPGGFQHLSELDLAMNFTVPARLDCPHLPTPAPLPLAHSNSMNAALAPFVSSRGIDVENMEGAAFFQVCLQEQQRFLEIRSISNEVKVGHDDWDFEGSIRQLSAGLNRVIDGLLRVEEK